MFQECLLSLTTFELAQIFTLGSLYRIGSVPPAAVILDEFFLFTGEAVLRYRVVLTTDEIDLAEEKETKNIFNRLDVM